MARAPLSGVYLPGKLREAIRLTGTCYVYAAGTTTAATVYGAESGAGTITPPVALNSGTNDIVGYVEAGYYDLSAAGVTHRVQVGSQDSKLSHLRDYTKGLSTLPNGYYDCNSDLVTLTSGTVIFAKLEPVINTIDVDTISLIVGQTESATETDQRVGIYSFNGTTFTRVGISGASTAMLETDDTLVANTLASGPFTLSPGTNYWAAVLSVASTAGTLVGFAPTGIGAATPAPSALEHPVPAYTLAGQTALDATEAVSGMTASYIIPWMFAYDAA